MSVSPPLGTISGSTSALTNPDQPTIFHITHWKAGSQWLHKILSTCAPERIVPPEIDEIQFLHQPLQPGKIYPTLYITRQQFESVQLPPCWYRFVVIRDLRDTLISAYFSIKVSHPLVDARVIGWRKALLEMDREAGLNYLMDKWLPLSVAIQRSWLEAGVEFVHYEALLEHDLEILERLLLVECRLNLSLKRLQEVVLANRFERLTRGRSRGQEDVTAHERKGVVGDWRHYFTEQNKLVFKARFNDLLVATGYERDLNW